MKSKTHAIGLLIFASMVLASCSSTGSSQPAATSAQPAAAPSTTDATAAAGTAYVAAFNTMISAVNADITAQNNDSADSTAQSTDINNQVTARQTFDTAVQAIAFPGSAKGDAQSVLSTDAALEAVLGTLAANTGNVSNYNSVFDTVTPAETAFTAADTKLGNDLGLTTTTTTSP